MALFRYFTRQEKPTNSSTLLTKTEVEEADKAVAKILEPTSKTSASRGKYNSYMSVQRGEIGRYAVENGATTAAKHFSSKWNVKSTARRLKTEYLEKLKEALKNKRGESVTVDSLVTKQKGRPLLLGEELDAAVQEYASSLRIAGGVVNTVVVRAAAEGIISARDIIKLASHGGHINIYAIHPTPLETALVDDIFLSSLCIVVVEQDILQLQLQQGQQLFVFCHLHGLWRQLWHLPFPLSNCL